MNSQWGDGGFSHGFCYHSFGVRQTVTKFGHAKFELKIEGQKSSKTLCCLTATDRTSMDSYFFQQLHPAQHGVWLELAEIWQETG